MVLKTKYSG